MKQSVCIVGLGYIGLPTAALLASRGYTVHGVDINDKVVATINRGGIHIVEPDLDTFVRAAVDSGRLKAYTKPVASDIFMICVPTPFVDEGTAIPTPDLSYVKSATEMVAPFVKPGNTVILESTSPVGTTEMIRDILKAKGVDLTDVAIAYCPERVLPGKIMHELVTNDRIVGGIDDFSANKVSEFYRDFVSGSVLQTNARTAEMTKLTENSFRDVNIAFANELSMLCEKLRVNVWELISLANRHPRVNILQPGPGVGGHCISVDPWFLVHQAPETARLIQTARIVNDSKPEFVLEQIYREVEKRKATSVCFLGLSFKANIDDLRESPALEIVRKFAQQKKCEVFAVEPHVEELPADLISLGVHNAKLADAVERSSVVVLLVDHDQFKAFPKEKLGGKAVIDTRGMWK